MNPENVVYVCDLFDLQILQDIQEPDMHIPGCPSMDAFSECNCSPTTVYAIGQGPEYAAGLTGFVTTPFFHSLEDLEEFCKFHKDRFTAIANNPDEITPDATGWEIPKKVVN